MYYFITFTATGHSGEDLRAFVDITQKGVTPTIVVYDRRGGEPTTAFTVEANETSVNLYVEYNGCYYNECVYNPDRGDIMLQNQYLITIDGENTDTRDRDWTLTIKAIGYGTDEDPTKTITVKQKGKIVNPQIKIWTDSTKTQLIPNTGITVDWTGVTIPYFVEYVDCTESGFDYDDGKVSGVTNSAASFIDINRTPNEDRTVITFKANNVGGGTTSVGLTVVHGGVHNFRFALNGGTPITIPVSGETYENTGSNGWSVVASNAVLCASPSGNVLTGSITRNMNWGVTFKNWDDREYISGSQTGETVTMPVGNSAQFYRPGSIVLNEDGAGSEPDGDTYVYTVELDNFDVYEETTIWAEGEIPTELGPNTKVKTNEIKFIQTNRQN